jgi:hypothetical protein
MGTRHGWLPIAAAIVVGLFIADRFVLTPLYRTWSSRSDEIAELRASLNEAQSLLEREEAIKEQWADMNARSLPKSTGDTESLVLRSVSEWASEAGVALSGMKPRWSDDKESILLECRASGSGSLRSIIQFVYSIETSPLALRVDELTLASTDERGARLNLDLRLTGLVLREDRQ